MFWGGLDFMGPLCSNHIVLFYGLFAQLLCFFLYHHKKSHGHDIGCKLGFIKWIMFSRILLADLVEFE